MAAHLIPTPRDGYPNERVRVTLDGSGYVIRWLWNGRGACWSFSIADADGVAILDGVRVAVGSDLLARTADDRRPIGPILVVDPTGQNSDPGLTELGKRVKVVYLDGATFL